MHDSAQLLMAPDTSAELACAIDGLQDGRLDDAEASLGRLLHVDADDPRALHLLGVLHARRGLPEKAVEPLQRAVALRPDDALARMHLSQTLTLLGRGAESLAQLEASLQLQPDNAAGLASHARAMMAARQPMRALGSIEHALSLAPKWAQAWQCRGEVLSLLVKMGMNRRAAAVESFRKALEFGGDADELTFQLAALGEGAVPAVMPANLVRRLFDAYAPKFDQHLTESLKYRTPEHLAQALQDAGVCAPLEEVWDLGCGTGLCAPLLRPMTRRLVGVDLSSQMLAVAKSLAVYDELNCIDIVDSLSERRADIDLLIAADVLVYLGALEGFFEASRIALRPGGTLAFSVEAIPDGGVDDFLLRATQRFAHARSYIDRLTLRYGFESSLQSRQVLREEMGEPVWGWIVVLRRRED